MKFYSDNTATISPEILAAIEAANQGPAKAYGDDPWTARIDPVLGEFFGTEVRAFPVSTGTAANSLALATLVPPYGAIVTHEDAHIVTDECGAPEFYSGGARLLLVSGPNGKVTPAALTQALDANPQTVHTVQPAAVSITQATELGTVYRPDELKALCETAHERRLHVHMDGARFANAIVSLGCHPADVTWRAGVDVLSFGATKNGALSAEAVVFFQPSLARDFELRRKRAGHLISKSRYISAQLLAYVETGVWQRNAKRANDFAALIGRAIEGAGTRGDAGAVKGDAAIRHGHAFEGIVAAPAAGSIRLVHPVEANEVFVHLGDDGKRALRDRGFGFYDWGALASGEARFVASWDQREEDVEALCAALRELPERLATPQLRTG